LNFACVAIDNSSVSHQKNSQSGSRAVERFQIRRSGAGKQGTFIGVTHTGEFEIRDE
jgi:hypothetical protein